MEDKAMSYYDQIMQALLAFAQDAKAFGGEQIPLLVQEALRYWTARHALLLLLSVGLLTVTFLTARWIRKASEDPDMWDHPGFICGCIFVFFGLAIGFMGAISNALDLLMVTMAPRLYLLEQLSSMVK